MVAYPDPRRWTHDQLEEARLLAIGDFVTGRNEETGESYAAILADSMAQVERLFTATDDLTALGDGAVLVTDPTLVNPLRYTAGPPISQDDLATMADIRKTPRAYTATEAEAIATLLKAAADRARLPWLDADPPRTADTTERRTAILTTASLWAAQRLATKRRNESSVKQEAAVRALLTAEDFTEVETGVITNVDDLARGEFCAESEVAGAKSDICVRLRNGRLLLIECKVSNSALNSVKRLNRDIGSKLGVWRAAFGAQAIPMGVLSGVFRRKNLIDAQNTGIAIVRERDLAPLVDFVGAAR
jgi:hypothetical protein